MALVVKVGVDNDLDLWETMVAMCVMCHKASHPWKTVEAVEVWVAVQQALDLICGRIRIEQRAISPHVIQYPLQLCTCHDVTGIVDKLLGHCDQTVACFVRFTSTKSVCVRVRGWDIGKQKVRDHPTRQVLIPCASPPLLT